MMRIVYFIILVVSALSLSACGDTSNLMPPSPLTHYTPSVRAQTIWQTSVGNGSGQYYYRLRPAANNGFIFADSYNGDVEALDANTGRVVWSENIGRNITSGVGIGNGRIFVGTGSATVIALSQKNGAKLWEKPVTSEVWAAPHYAQGLLLVHTITGNLSALSAITGKRIWRYDEHVPTLILHAASEPQVAGDQAIAGFSDGQLVVLSLQSGNTAWQQQIATPQGTSIIQQMIDITVNPIVINGVVYVATYQGRISALSLDNGQLIWTHKLSSFAGMAADSSRIYVSDAESRVWAFDQSSGAVDWRQTHLLARRVTGPAVYQGHVAVADGLGYVHFLSRSDGHFLGRIEIGNAALASPLVYHNKLYVMSASGELSCVQLVK